MRKVRELAMQVLFLWDANANIDLALGWQATDFGDFDEALRMKALHMAEQTWAQREMMDAWVERLAPQWPPRRQPGVDRNILRLAIWELTNSATPPKVVLDEAIELAKEFSTEQSPAFVNGVLDAVLREKIALTAEPRLEAAEQQTQSAPESDQTKAQPHANPDEAHAKSEDPHTTAKDPLPNPPPEYQGRE
jgi:N utilization substance protein B